MSPATAELPEVLKRARAAGFLGPGPVEPHIAHAGGFGESVERALGREPTNFADLGTGGGVPGLVLGLRWPSCRGIFVESGRRRCAWLREAVVDLGLEARIDVVELRAEATGRDDRYREQFEAVTARSFAGPAVTGEIAAGLVAVDGVLVVSEPPDPDVGRWPSGELQDLGFGPAAPAEVGSAHFVVVRKLTPTPERFPRSVGRPAKRPLW